MRRVVNMALVLSMAAFGIAASAASQEPDSTREQPRVEYLVKHTDLHINMNYESGPDIKTKSSSNTKLSLTTSAIHNYPRAVLFLVFELRGFDAKDNPIPINPASDKSQEERRTMPLSERKDGVVTAVFFDAPWPGGDAREFTQEIPVGSQIFNIASLSYVTYVVGYEPKNAIALLGDPLLNESTRESVATWVSKAVGKQYQFVTDDGRWITPKDLPETMPRATLKEHVSSDMLSYAGASQHGSEIVVRNKTQNAKTLRLAGGGRDKWFTVAAQKQTILEVEPGLLAITLQGKLYSTHTVEIKPNARYTFDYE